MACQGVPCARDGLVPRSYWGIWLVRSLGIQPGAAVLDLGCGPGLYAVRLAQRGFAVTGVDYSRRSIDYATAFAKQNELDIQYRYQDYLTLEDSGKYDVAMLVYATIVPFRPGSAASCFKTYIEP